MSNVAVCFLDPGQIDLSPGPETIRGEKNARSENSQPALNVTKTKV